MNENKNKNIPDDGSDISSSSSTPEDTKAFSFEWTDPEAQTDGAQAEEPDSHTEPDGEAEPISESPLQNEAEPDNASETPSAGKEYEDEEKDDIKDGAETTEPYVSVAPDEPKSQRPSVLLRASCILSGVAMLLLLVFAIGSFAGLFPSNIRDSIFSGVSTLGPTDPEADAPAGLIEEVMTSVVIVQSRSKNGISTGTGMIISNDGYIITNYHVIDGGVDNITVSLFGEQTAVSADVVGFKASDDIAVIKIERDGLRAVTFADSNDVRYGEKVYAIGTPEGTEFGWSVTQGIVSCPRRQIMMPGDNGTIEKKMNVVQTDASVNHGNSGGPLINVRGEVVGVITLKLSSSAGMGFALPSDGVLIDVEAILKYGHANNVDSGISSPRPIVGITGVNVLEKTWYMNIYEDGKNKIDDITEEEAKSDPENSFYAAVTGIYVSNTTQGMDAATKLKSGDIITKINGNSIIYISELTSIVNQYDHGDIITVEYYRDGKYHTADIVLGSAS